jgi:carboxyl-terminal processing protease
MKDSINLKNLPAVDRKGIEDNIKAYLARLRWRTQGLYQVLNATDPVVKKAEEVLAK